MFSEKKQAFGATKRRFSMLRPDDQWFLDEVVDEPSELLKVLPEIRQYLEPSPNAGELGLRSLMEEPEPVARRWWRDHAGVLTRDSLLRPRAA
jgi:hypothetical protein